MTALLEERATFQKEAFHTFCDGLDHPEGLAFDNEGTLWAGGELGQIYRIDESGHAVEVARLGGFCLGITLSAKQDLWVCNSGLHSLMQVDRGGNVLQSISGCEGRALVTPNFSVIGRLRNKGAGPVSGMVIQVWVKKENACMPVHAQPQR